MRKNTIKVAGSFKLVLVALFVALVGLQTPGAGASATAQTAAPTQGTELASSAEAKRGLAKINPRNYAKIKSGRERAALQRSYNALKAIADNTSRAREAALMASFDRAMTTLKGLPPPAAGSFQQCDESFKLCMEICNKNGNTCDMCKMGNGMCYLVQWGIARTNEGNPTY
jgi:hypothetical protein